MKTTPMRAIRGKCLDCCCEQVKAIRECRIETCALWPYRMGHRPPKTGKGTVSAVDAQNP
jgi:hypothetical protein